MKRLFFILIISIFFNSLFYSSGLFHHDSYVLADSIKKTVDSGNIDLTTGGKAGTVVLYSLFHYIIKDLEFSMYVANLFFLLCLLTVVYLFVWELYNKDTAFIVTLLFGFSPLLLSLSNYPKSHIIALFWILLAFYTVLLDMKNIGQLSLRSGLFITLAIFCRTDSIIQYFCLIIFFLYIDKIIGKIYLNKISFWNILCLGYPSIILIFGIILNKFAFYGNDHFSFNIVVILYILLNFIIAVSIIPLFYLKFNKVFAMIIGINCIFLFLSTTSIRFFLFPVLLVYIMFGAKLVSFKSYWREIIICLVFILSIVIIFPVLNVRSMYDSGYVLYSSFNQNTDKNDIIIAGDESAILNYYGEFNISSSYVGGRKNYILSGYYNSLNYTYDYEILDSFLYEDYHHTELFSEFSEQNLYLLNGNNPDK